MNQYPCTEHKLEYEDYESRAIQLQECANCNIKPEKCICKKIINTNVKTS